MTTRRKKGKKKVKASPRKPASSRKKKQPSVSSRKKKRPNRIRDRFGRFVSREGATPDRKNPGRWLGIKSTPAPARDTKGRFVSTRLKSWPKAGRSRDPNILIKQLADTLEQVDFDVRDYEVFENLFTNLAAGRRHVAKTFHTFEIYLGESYPIEIDLVLRAWNVFHEKLSPYYQGATFFRLLVEQRDHKGKSFMRWVNMSARMDFEAAFNSIDFRVNDWMMRNHYAAFRGLSVQSEVKTRR